MPKLRGPLERLQPWLAQITKIYFLSSFFSSPNIVAIVLLQKNEEDKEQLMEFFSQVLKDAKLKYDILEKQSYALVKVVKDFKAYAL